MEAFDEVLANRVGQTVGGRWVLRHLLGAGGMAAVYAAEDPEGRRAAIKLLHPEMGIRRDIRERFLLEADVMTRISHPGMVTIYERGTDANTAYLAMELLEGEVISDRARRLGRVSPGEVLSLLDQVLDVLIAAHAQGVIHRDLKPENLFLTREGRIKVLDFGLARLLDDGPTSFRTRTGAALGTLPYMAPEQALGRRNEVDARTDLFALGATAFRLLAGRKVHEAPSEAELLMRMASEPAPPVESVVADLPTPLGMIIDRALAFAKQQRYPDARTMQQDVRAVSAGAMPTYAASYAERDQTATRVDLASPRSSPSKDGPELSPIETRRAPVPTSVERNPFARSQRAVAATVVMPGSSAQARSPAGPAGPNAPTAADDFALAPTVVPATQDHGLSPEPASIPHREAQRVPLTLSEIRGMPDPTLVEPEPLRLPIAAVPPGSAPASLPTLAKRRRRTLVTGFALVFVLLVVTTALAIAFVKTRRAASQDHAPSVSSPSGANSSVSPPSGDRLNSTSSRSNVAPHSSAATGGTAPANGRTTEERGDGRAPASPHDGPGPKSGFLPTPAATPAAAGSTTPPPSSSSQVKTSVAASSTHRGGKVTRTTGGKSASVKASATRKKRVRTQ